MEGADLSATDFLNPLLDPAFEGMRTALRSAFEIGRRVGREEAEASMKAKVAEAFGFAAVTDEQPSATQLQPEIKTFDGNGEPSSRAPRGSVRPAIIECMDMLGPVTKEQIAQYTGVNFNSIRGTLNGLRLEGMAKRDGDRWSLISTKPPRIRAVRSGPSIIADQHQTLDVVADTSGQAEENTEEAEPDSSQEQPATSGRSIFG